MVVSFSSVPHAVRLPAWYFTYFTCLPTVAPGAEVGVCANEAVAIADAAITKMNRLSMASDSEAG